MCTQEVSNEAKRRLLLFSGGLAQLGEHLLCKQGVVGSIPSSSTTKNQHQSGFEKVCFAVGLETSQSVVL
jgi:hypothetical protein